MSFVTVGVIVEHLDSGTKDIQEYCLGLSGKDHQKYCFGYATWRLIQIDPREYVTKALEVCETAKRLGLEEDCYKQLLVHGFVSFHRASPEQRAYCEKLPESLREKCLNPSS